MELDHTHAHGTPCITDEDGLCQFQCTVATGPDSQCGKRAILRWYAGRNHYGECEDHYVPAELVTVGWDGRSNPIVTFAAHKNWSRHEQARVVEAPAMRT